ncbi:MAG TPA: response regulator transcription factor [Gaiellaceae bacterium]|jgi:DNA-binding response OmpR family regulator|nr:response regulator transcription factor [Gaiellaceae bacterium]
MTGRTSSCGRVLVVDDDERFRGFVAATLGTAGFESVEAATGPEALACADSEPFDVVLLDVLLPGISGYEVCRMLRDRFGESLPILFVSGVRTEAIDRVAGLLVGGDDYLVKPFAPDELVARVCALLRRRERARAPIGNGWGLTPRETEVLGLLASGLGQAEIASRLVISPKTVGTHIEHILSKTGARSRAQAVALAHGAAGY